MEQIIEFLTQKGWLQYVTSVITIASAIAAMTPTPKEGSVWAKLYKAVDWLALNIGKAKDKGSK